MSVAKRGGLATVTFRVEAQLVTGAWHVLRTGLSYRDAQEFRRRLLGVRAVAEVYHPSRLIR